MTARRLSFFFLCFLLINSGLFLEQPGQEIVDAAAPHAPVMAAGEGLADHNTIFVVNHFSHNGGWLHEEITERAAAYDMIASYDGMEIQV